MSFSTIQAHYPDMRFTPIQERSKKAFYPDWAKKPFTYSDLPAIGSFVECIGKENKPYKVKCGGYGQLFGFGGYVGVDHDGPSVTPWLSERGITLPDTLTITSGKTGHFLKIYRIPDSLRELVKTIVYPTGVKNEITGKDEQLELRWFGCQSVVCGIHPETGKPYQVISDAPITELPAKLIGMMRKPEVSKTHQKASQSRTTWNDADWAREYLAAIDPNKLDYYQWRDCVFAADDAGVSESEVLAWSQTSAKHTDKGFSGVWKHLDGEGITVATLGYYAKEQGWVSPNQKTNRKQSQSQGEQAQSEESKAWSQSGLANFFVNQYSGKFRYCLETEQWYTYDKGQWRQCKTRVIERALIRLVKNTTNQTFKTDLIRGAANLALLEMSEREWLTDRKYLPLLNGVLNLETKELLPHSPDFDLRWQLPYEYDPQAKCPKIIAWLLETVKGDAALVEILRAYLNAILLGRTDLQKYLELIGPGGTGKSTLIRLAQALVGLVNSFATELKRLETNRFETAGLVDKRLAVVTDSEHYGGTVSVLKAITGQDSIPIERKYQNVGDSYTPECLVIVAANETIQSGDYTSGLARRRLTVPFLNQVPSDKQKTLISFVNGKVTGDFASELPGLLNWVLELDNERVADLIRSADTDSEVLRQYKADTLINSNPIAAWVDECLIFDPTEKTYVGSGKKIRQSFGDKDTGYVYQDFYEFWQTQLYPSYCQFCLDSGVKILALRRFVALLKDLLENQLGWQIAKAKGNQGSFFSGVKIRKPSDSIPRPISETLVCANF